MASTGETKASTSSSIAEEKRKERIIKLKKEIDNDDNLIEQMKNAKDEEGLGSDIKNSLELTIKEVEKDTQSKKNQQQLLELTQQKKKGALSGFDKKLEENLKKTKQGGKRKTKRRKRTRRKKRTKRRRRSSRHRRSKKRRTRRRRKTKRRRGGTLGTAPQYYKGGAGATQYQQPTSVAGKKEEEVDKL